jgi:hypothetical protein
MDEWLPSSLPEVGSTCLKILKDTCLEFHQIIRQYAEINYGIILSENIAKALLKYSNDSLIHFAHSYLGIQQAVSRIRPSHVFTPTAGKSFIRALSLAVRNSGGRITGFSHGYYICHLTSPRQSWHELATVDEFVSYFPGSKELIQQNIEINPIPRNNKVEIINENNPVLFERWNKWRDKPLPPKIRTVMILELKLNPDWAAELICEDLINYHFYYKLCRILSDHNYNIIFKKRPKDLKWEGIDFFRNIPNLKVIEDDFESGDMLEQVDAVFVQYAMSSTLFWSMCSNRTVIYVDNGLEPWFPEVRKSMVKRCRILYCWFDERNRQCFDEKQLLDILSVPQEKPNTEFLEKYLFPDKQLSC